MNGLIKISVLEVDNEDVQFQIEIENYCCRTSIDFYGAVESFKDFGHKLAEFPKSIDDIVVFQLGEDDGRWAYYIVIKAFCYDISGHATLSVLVHRHGGDVNGYRIEFSIISEAASINSLGQKLATWNPLESKEIIWESFASWIDDLYNKREIITPQVNCHKYERTVVGLAKMADNTDDQLLSVFGLSC